LHSIKKKRMKKYYITLSAILCFLSFYAQEAKDISLDKSIMKQALVYGDNTIATSSLYSIIAKEGATSTYKDSLAYVYFSARKYSSCFLVCTDILSRNSSKVDVMEMQAISLENLGVYEKAAQSYAKLVVKSNNNYHAYKLATLYYSLKKNKEGLNAIKKAEELEDTGKIKITTAINKNLNQQVALKAAIANLKGLLQYASDDLDGAKKSFQQALAIEPEFKLAKDNVEAAEAGKLAKKE